MKPTGPVLPVRPFGFFSPVGGDDFPDSLMLIFRIDETRRMLVSIIVRCLKAVRRILHDNIASSMSFMMFPDGGDF